MVEMKQVGLDPAARTKHRVFLSWLFDECQGRMEDLGYLEAAGLITDDDIIDWETAA